MLVKSVVRYLANRHAVQTVYWRTAIDSDGKIRTMKQIKMCHFGPKDGKINSTAVVKELTDYYGRFTLFKHVWP